jgi:hypothetical protein
MNYETKENFKPLRVLQEIQIFKLTTKKITYPEAAEAAADSNLDSVALGRPVEEQVAAGSAKSSAAAAVANCCSAFAQHLLAFETAVAG